MKDMGKPLIQPPKGFRDFLPEDMRKWSYVVSILRRVLESYGFEPLETSSLEYEEILAGKYGEEGNKLMYRFTDAGGRRVALRYDQTVPLARVVAQYGDKLPMPFKRYQSQSVWRAEKPQKGRYREFVQCDIDTVGTSSLMADAEIIACTLEAMRTLGFKDLIMRINDREIFSGVDSKYLGTLDKLEKIGKDGVIAELVEKGMSKTEAQKLLDSMLKKEPTQRLKELFSYLETYGLVEGQDFEFSPTLVRGLDYYTGVIFELVDRKNLALSLAGGGRYDNLIGIFANRAIPAVGISFGLDRIIETMDERGLFPKGTDSPTSKVLVTVFDKNLALQSIKVASALRSADINVDLYPNEEDKLDKQLKYADKRNIPWVIIIGPEETAKGSVKLKNMASGEEEILALEDVVKKLS